MKHPYAIVHTAERATVPVEGTDLAEGLESASLVGPSEGSVHMQISHSVLQPGGHVAGHMHAYEESFFILAGQVALRMGGRDALLGSGDYGVVPLGVPHAWKNVAGEPVRWLRIRVPQPRDTEDEMVGTYGCPGFGLPDNAAPPPFGLPSVRSLGHFSEDQLPPPGPVSIRGTNNYAVRNVAVRLMVDSTLGAYHHTAFVGQMASDSAHSADVPPPHYHAFEEMYYFISGTARGLLEGEEYPISAGDVAFAGVNATHGFVPTGDEPLRWIEVMAPVPPEQDSMMFVRQWQALQEAAREGRW